MVGKRGPILITCQNPDCAYFLVDAGKHITKNGHNHAGNQQYFCHRCAPAIVGCLSVVVIDNLSGIDTPKKIGPVS